MVFTFQYLRRDKATSDDHGALSDQLSVRVSVIAVEDDLGYKGLAPPTI